MPQESNITCVRDNHSTRAVVFVHGFSGARDDTWDRFPGLFGTAIETADWDIYTIGYATTLLPDIVGIWSADPDLPILATMLRGQLALPPFDRYRSLALIAHSMGGLVVQQALVDDPALAGRLKNVILFGSPSGGLRKAGWLSFWKRQLMNMSAGSDFITALRREWTRLYAKPPFNFLVVAGANDQFVPPESSLAPFDKAVQRVVPGDHIAIVKPATADAPSVHLVVATLAQRTPPNRDRADEVRLAAELPTRQAPALVAALETRPAAMSVREIVDAALALDRGGRRQESIALLEQHQEKDTDIQGALAGRFKRLWYETDDERYAERALMLYGQALQAATTPDQIYYLAINVAFMQFVYRNDLNGAQVMARRALEHAFPPVNDVWKTATVAEANLYFGRTAEALAEYRKLLTIETEEWKRQSAGLQAGRIAAKLGDLALAEKLEEIFTPAARQVNRIFISYSHKDGVWLDRLKVMIAPYLREAEAELDLWDDTRVAAGQRWDDEIRNALARAGVAVALVSADFLASSYIMEHEFPVMVEASNGGLQLLWVYISSALWEETPLQHFQATHDPKAPLDSLPLPQQNEILKSIARQIKRASLGATDRFRT